MNLKKVLHIIYWLAGICCVLIVLGSVLQNGVLYGLGFLCIFALFYVNIRYWRCPECGRHLGRDKGRYCRHCSHELTDLW